MSSTAPQSGPAPESHSDPALSPRKLSPGEFAGLRHDELLQVCERLYAENQKRTLALASAAHELKTPLAIMTGYLELLLSNRIGSLSEKQSQVLRAMQANSVRLESWIQDFLTYASFETGTLTIEPYLGDLTHCLRDIYNIWLPAFQNKGVALYHHGGDAPLEFQFDYHKLQRVVSTLVDNAFLSTPAGGTVWLGAELCVWERRTHQAKNVSVDQRRSPMQEPNAVKVSVSDTGPGIAPEYHQEIFEDFVSFRPAQGGEFGTGLGLGIARRLVLAQQGKIWVESEIGSGSKFCFALPLKPF